MRTGTGTKSRQALQLQRKDKQDRAQAGRQKIKGGWEAADVRAETADMEGDAQKQTGFCVSDRIVSTGVSQKWLVLFGGFSCIMVKKKSLLRRRRYL